MTEVEKKIAYLEKCKSQYRESLNRSIFTKAFYSWIEQELLGELNYTPNKLAMLGVPSSEFSRIMTQEKENTKEAFIFLMEQLAMQAPFSTDFMKKMHGILLDKITFDNGNYRREPVRLVATSLMPLNPYEIHFRMKDMEKIYHQSSDKIRSILDLNYEIIVSQPFSDGNKRIARMCMNFELMRNGYCPLFVYKADRDNYLSVIEKRFIGKGDEPYYKFMLDEMEETMHRSVAILTGKGRKVLSHQDNCAKIAVQNSLKNYCNG